MAGSVSGINLRHAFRALVKTPFISSVAILSLSLGIGANAATFSVFNQAILRPLPVPAPGELVNLTAPGPKPGSQAANRAGFSEALFSYPMFRDLERVQTGFTGIGAHRGFVANLAYHGQTLSGAGMLVSGSYFGVLRLQAALGRLIDQGDEPAVGASPVVVLAHDYWRSRFEAANVLHDTLLVNGQPMTIVGVAPAGFDGTTLGSKPQVFVPITMRGLAERFDAFDNRRSYWVYLFARLSPGVSMVQAQTAIDVPYRAILNEVEATLQFGMSGQTLERFKTKEILLEDGRRGQSAARDRVRPSGVLLLWVTGTVLLISCVNIANLLLARSATRATEMAIRLSVGCSRGRLVLQLLSESYVLTAFGAIGAVLVARWTLVLIKHLIPPEAVALIPIELNVEVLIIIGVLAITTGVVFGLVPALQSTRPDVIATLRAQAGQAGGSSRGAARFRVVLATTQLALSMALLVSAGLLTKSLLNISQVDLGLDVENVVTFRLSPGLSGYTPQRALALFEQVEGTLAAVPGVTGVTAARVPLLAGASSGRDVRVQGFEPGPDTDRSSRYNEIGTDYFRTLGIPVLAGREFTRADALGAPKVAIVNDVFLKKFQLGREAIGMRIASDGGDVLDTEIVGVVANTKYAGVKAETPPQFYLPYRQDDLIGTICFYVRSSLDPATLVGSIPGLVRTVDPDLPVQDLKTMPQQVSDNVFIDRGVSVLAALFAGLATLLAGIGLYGVLAYTVAQRTREIGVRMALGADGARVRGMILGQVGRITIVGGVIGISAALVAGRLGRTLLFELNEHDPSVLLVATLLLALVALGAGAVPALRASRVDPMRALRYE